MRTKRSLFVAVLIAGVAGLSGVALAGSPLKTGVISAPAIRGANDELQFARIKGAGASFVTIPVNWDEVAPTVRPPRFDPSKRGDPAYRWGPVDQRVRLARKHGLSPILVVSGAPRWAQGKVPPGPPPSDRDGPYKPNPAQLGMFARAVAGRYSGNFRHLPRVRYYVAWNEPNIYRYLTPQRVNGRAFSPDWYRRMLNAFSDSVHRARPSNVVIGGALASFGIGRRLSPLLFMRRLLCLSKGPRPHPTCRQRASFDVWSHHPYTRGNPFHHAANPDDVSLGDLPKMRRLLNAAVRAHKVKTDRKVQFWVDEISYDSHPPDPSKLTVPILLHARWTAEALYQMWRSGVNVAIWFLIRDEPVGKSDFQSGLYFAGAPNDLSRDRPKPALTAFRFPFVAYRHGTRVSVWGRTPKAKRGPVTIQVVGTRHGWRRVAQVHARRGGIFTARLKYARIKKSLRGKPSRLTYRSAVIADKPRSYWRLDERAGTVARDELHRANGTYLDRPERGGKGALAGKVNWTDTNRSVRFFGGARVALPSMTPPRAVELWLKTTDGGNLPATTFLDAAGGPLRIGSIDRLLQASGLDSSLFSYGYVDDGRWHHVVYSLDGGTARLYVDGRLNDQTAWHPLWDVSEANIAYDPLLNASFRGSLDEVAIYDHPLSAKQVERHYMASGRKPPELGMLRAKADGQAAWPFSLKRPKDRFVLAFG
jgi:Concanavalin A-like lectin/glucanases superfamily